nr:DUF308 domain-containing protein [Rhodococcus sp. HNM0569]
MAGAAWWAGAVRGVLAILFGIVALAWPGITTWALVVVFGVYSVVDGVIAVVRAYEMRRTDPGWGWWAALGVVSILAGILALVWPTITALVLLYIIAFYAIVFGILGAVGAFRLRHLPGSGWGWFLVAALLAILFGILLLLSPGSGILGIVWLVGWYAIVFGVLLIIGAFSYRERLRNARG